MELLNPDEFRIVNVVYQEVLRLLCMESRANVVIVDHMPSRNQERLEPGAKLEEQRVDFGTLLNKARAKGITREQVVTVARSEYQNFSGDLKSLDPAQLDALMARVDRAEPQPSDRDQKAGST